MEQTLKELRKKSNYTQKEAAEYFHVSLRSYKDYENNPNKQKSMKYKYMVIELEKMNYIDEDQGILKLEDITGGVKKVLDEYKVEYCYLFGSYAKGKAKETSDVDLLISTEVRGIRFYGLVEKLRNELHKKIDLINVNQLENNPELINEILKDGIKIYG